MSTILRILPYLQIIISIVLVISILLQQSGAGVGGALGGSDSLGAYHTKRGLEKTLFYVAIVCSILFALIALLSVLLK